MARCTRPRWMKSLGQQRVIRRGTYPAAMTARAAPCPHDNLNRRLLAPRPNALRVSDFTDVASWREFVFVASVLATHGWRGAGWLVSSMAHARCGFAALDRALHARRPSHRGSPYPMTSILAAELPSRPTWNGRRKRASRPHWAAWTPATRTALLMPSMPPTKPTLSTNAAEGGAFYYALPDKPAPAAQLKPDGVHRDRGDASYVWRITSG